jgi:urea transporter
MIGLTIIAFVLTVVATTATLTGLVDAELLSIVALGLAAFTVSCVIASWLTWEPRHQRDEARRSRAPAPHS